ncbi:MAG: DUF2239 family protein [Proteobacteria bacterium]|nr:DUF2239 family protein [Pseudomonadota bacterium]
MSNQAQERVFVGFVGHELLARGGLADVVRAAKRSHDEDAGARICVYEEEGASLLELDLRGSIKDVLDRLAVEKRAEGAAVEELSGPGKRGPGRPRLGVISGEVSLLPKHWKWLREQRSSASATLRRLVDADMKARASERARERAIDAAHRMMWDLAGDLPGFEEAGRALFAQDFSAFRRLIEGWPEAIQGQMHRFIDRVQVSEPPPASVNPRRAGTVRP